MVKRRREAERVGIDGSRDEEKEINDEDQREEEPDKECYQGNGNKVRVEREANGLSGWKEQEIIAAAIG